MELIHTALTIAFPAVYFTGAIFPPKIVLLLYPRYAPPPPSGDSAQGKALMGETEKDLQKLWIVARLRTREGWYETRKFFSCQIRSKNTPPRLYARPGKARGQVRQLLRRKGRMSPVGRSSRT